jgi:soluble lytic murein transglycosylase-like protein
MTSRKGNELPVMIAVAFAVMAVATALFGPWQRESVAPEQVWAKAVELGARHDMDPLLIYAIACAESGLDAHAGSGKARGLMQMTAAAWKDATSRPFSDAWDWRRNMEAACAYLAILRQRQIGNGCDSWPALAAAYRLGPGTVERLRCDLSSLPRQTNDIYRELFAGRTPKLPPPAPQRPISSHSP